MIIRGGVSAQLLIKNKKIDNDLYYNSNKFPNNLFYSWFAINLSGCARQCQPPTPAGSDNGINNIFYCVVPPTLTMFWLIKVLVSFTETIIKDYSWMIIYI